MKTSILVSGFAALCLLITFAEAPKRYNAEKENANLASNFTYTPANIYYVTPAENKSANHTDYADVKSNVKLVNDFTYLKFNVADYSENTEIATEALPENSLDYLKFDVTEYTETSEITSPDAIELPVNEFDHLKFDVSKFTKATNLNLSEITELPVDDFSYLKFNINNPQSSLNSDNFGEMPIN